MPRTAADLAALRGFGRRLRALREGSGLTQEQLALRAGLDRGYISSIEAGKRNLALINLCKLANALGVSPCELLRDILGSP